ncbi:unnamed protein product [Eretmochelys imbricata]
MHGEKNRPVAYFSATLDPVAEGLPPCLRAVAAAARLVEISDSLVLRSPLTLLVPHSVETPLPQRNTGHLSSARLTRYELLLLSASYITIKRCSQLNPATLLPLSNDGDPHNCLATVSELSPSRALTLLMSLSLTLTLFYLLMVPVFKTTKVVSLQDTL